MIVIDNIDGIRWATETKDAAAHAGWSVLKTACESDCQGWGVHLLVKVDEASALVAKDCELEGRQADAAKVLAAAGAQWAVMSWSYGSCSGCDMYEDLVGYDDSPEKMFEIFGELIEPCQNEEAARMKFEEKKGW